MAQRRSLAWTELRVGVLVIASFALLLLAIFSIGGQSGILTPKYRVTAYFPTANGLRNGAEVWLEGVTIGNVSAIRISGANDPMRSVEADLRLDARFKDIIKSDSKLTIETTGLLGDNHVDISRGMTGQPVADGGVLQGAQADDIRKIITGTNDILANLDILSDRVVQLAGRIDRGEGTLGKLLSDSSIYDNLNKTTQEMHELVRDAHSGNGTLAKLVSDDEVYRKFTTIMTRMDNIASKVEAGEGTAGKLLNDPAVYNRAEQVLTRVDNIASKIERGEGTLGKVMTDDSLYNEMRTTMDRLSSLIAAMENGEGTVGKLVKDPTLYNNLNQTSSEIQKLLYDFRQDPKKFLTINFRLF